MDSNSLITAATTDTFPPKHSHDKAHNFPNSVSKASSHSSQLSSHLAQYSIRIASSSSTLTWKKSPERILVFRKPDSNAVRDGFKKMVTWLILERNLKVFVEESTEPEVIENNLALQNPTVKQKFLSQLVAFKFRVADLTETIDLIICLGGDGTLLFVSSLFQRTCPPVMSFNMGTLGFLTPFEYCKFDKFILKVLRGEASFILRSRLKVKIIKKDSTITTNVLNEVVLDRGPSGFVCNLDLFVDNHYVTSVQGDGLIISTPTGSTAYSMSAGASMIHPSVPSILITSINAHSLSFRPVVLPAGVKVRLSLAPNSRNHACVFLDGKERQDFGFDDSVEITTSNYPVPAICKKDQIYDWFSGLAHCLHWNVRKMPCDLDPVLHDNPKAPTKQSKNKQNISIVESASSPALNLQCRNHNHTAIDPIVSRE